jgi:hypothetical protein
VKQQKAEKLAQKIEEEALPQKEAQKRPYHLKMKAVKILDEEGGIHMEFSFISNAGTRATFSKKPQEAIIEVIMADAIYEQG